MVLTTAVLVTLLVITLAACAAGLWVKGNTHTHTTQSDGDSPPEKVVEWYESHGYNFLVLSDHNKVVDPAGYDADLSDNFLLIPGEEISANSSGAPVHVNALGVKSDLPPLAGVSLANCIRKNVEAILAAGGVAIVNHPNFGYAFDHQQLKTVTQLDLFEIYNGHPAVNNAGDSAHPSVEQIWDNLLSLGTQVYGVAADDAHHFATFGLKCANPGRGWIMVRVNELSQSEILEKMREGDFYASTGVELGDYSVSRSAIEISIEPVPGVRYVTEFIGLNGQALHEVKGRLAIYRFTGDSTEAYVRARITASDGSRAWTQPVRRKS